METLETISFNSMYYSQFMSLYLISLCNDYQILMKNRKAYFIKLMFLAHLN